MPGYQYKAIGIDGKERKGNLIAASVEQAEGKLKSDGLITISLLEDIKAEKHADRKRESCVEAGTLRIFCHQFVTITGAGVSAINALQMLGEQTENRILRRSITALVDAMGKGITLSQAMREQDRVFSNLFVSLVEAGEAEGNLQKAFEGMAAYYEEEEKMEAAVKRTVVYPTVTLWVAIGVILAILILVIPNFMKMFSDMDIRLNAYTRGVIAVSSFFAAYWWVFAAVVLFAFAIFKIYSYTERGRGFFSSLKMKSPLFGGLRIKAASAKLARMLSILLKAHIPMEEALAIAGEAMGKNVLLRKTVQEAKEQVKNGAALSKPLQNSGLFPPLLIHMVSIGEETGDLAAMLETVAKYYEEETINQAEHLAAVVEPVLILAMAAIVGMLILAVMQPMLALYDAVGNM